MTRVELETFMVKATCLTGVAAATLIAGLVHAQTPPEQPATGPGGKAYAHAQVSATRIGSAADEVFVFEPADPVPAQAPVVVFCHGWGAMNPTYYGAWITHIVRRGFSVIYPRYQADLRTPPADFTPNALTATSRGLEILRSAGHVRPDARGLAFVGHSMGGLVAANLAARAARGELPAPLVLMAVEPGKTWPEASRAAAPLDDLSVLPPELLLVTLVGDDDDLVYETDARKIYRGATAVARTNKDYVRMRSDDHGTPVMLADHRAPTAPAALPGVDPPPAIGPAVPKRERSEMGLDALDYFGTWKLFDGLADAVFRGVSREYALGDTPQQRFMGHWSDGVPVRELVIAVP